MDDDAPKSSHIHSISDASHESCIEPDFMEDNSSDKGDQIMDSQDRVPSSAPDAPIEVVEAISSVSFDTSDGYMIHQNAEIVRVFEARLDYLWYIRFFLFEID